MLMQSYACVRRQYEFGAQAAWGGYFFGLEIMPYADFSGPAAHVLFYFHGLVGSLFDHFNPLLCY
jgi:hypothetical protein